jgi:hypothetical protein
MEAQMRTLGLILCLVAVVGCSGGGGSGSETSSPDPATRDEAFAREALMRAEDDAIVMCQMIVCPIADGDREVDRGDGTMAHICRYNCMESEIDASGETRHFFVYLLWERFADGCYDPDTRVVLLLAENTQLCAPNQER